MNGRAASRFFTVLLSIVMLGVIFGILTDSRNSILIKEIIYVAGAAAAALAAAAVLLAGGRAMFSRVPARGYVTMAAILAWGLFMHHAGIGSVNGPYTMLMLFSLTVLTLTGILFIDKDDARLFGFILLASSALVYLYALLQWRGINIFSWDAALSRTGRTTGTMGNPNLLGGFASALLPFGIHYLWSKDGIGGRKGALLAIVYGVLAVAAVIASGTRGSIIGVTAGSGFLAVHYARSRGGRPAKAILAAGVFLAVLAAASLPMASRLSELDPEAKDQGTLQVRKLIWSGAYGVFAERPLTGHGPGSFQILYPSHRNPEYSILGVSHNTLHAHCEYLEILTDTGMVGLFLWGLLLFFLGKTLKGWHPLNRAAFAGLLAMLAEAFVSVHLRWPPTAWLFATLLMVVLIRGGTERKPSRYSLPAALLLGASGIVLAWGVVGHYIPLARSSSLVFMGKDVYLTRADREMNAAYAAAARWASTGDPAFMEEAAGRWMSAASLVDTAVEYCSLGAEICPSDLGAWYALGSARLTRHIVMSPHVAAISSALEQTGTGYSHTLEDAREELLLGMAAYDSLVARAPNYAEVHNNYALGYSNLGMPRESMESLYRAYRLHAHRRNDYFSQTVSLLPLEPSSLEGALLYFHHIVRGADTGSTGDRQQAIVKDLRRAAAFILAAQPENADTLRAFFTGIITEELPEELASICIQEAVHQSGFAPFHEWREGILENEPPESGLNILHDNLLQAVFAGRAFPSVYPVDREFYTLPARLSIGSQVNMDSFDRMMDIHLLQIVLDRSLDEAFIMFNSGRFSHLRASPQSIHLNYVREAIGGSRASMRSGGEMPWMQGSLPEVLSDSLHRLMEEDGGNTLWYRMEMSMSFLQVSSYWWDFEIFTQPQNHYLLERIFFCRDALMELHPNSWQGIVGSLLDGEIARISQFTGGRTPVNVQHLRSDLVRGYSRGQ